MNLFAKVVRELGRRDLIGGLVKPLSHDPKRHSTLAGSRETLESDKARAPAVIVDQFPDLRNATIAN
jgi:hypothetical protein